MLRTIVDMTFLLLAVIIIVVLLKDAKGRELVDTARNDVAIVKQEVEKTLSNNIHYMETRVNKAEERQDSYQSSTSRRLNVLEQRLSIIEQKSKQTQRVVNNNINTMTNNN
mgnify:CR=1 FL=1